MNWNKKRVAIFLATVLLVAVNGAFAQRTARREIIQIKPGETRTVSLKGESSSDFTSAQVMLSGRKLTKSNLIKVSFDRKTRNGREMKISVSKDARMGQVFIIQGFKGKGGKITELPFEIRVVKAAKSEAKKSKPNRTRNSPNERSGDKANRSRGSSRDKSSSNRGSDPPQRERKTLKSISVSVARGHGTKMQLSGKTYLQMTRVRLVDESNRTVSDQLATAKLRPGRAKSLLEIKIKKAPVGSKLSVHGQINQQWIRVPIVIHVVSGTSKVALQVDETTLVARDNRGRLKVVGPGQGSTTVRMPGGGTMVIGPDKYPGGSEMGMVAANPNDKTGGSNGSPDAPVGAIANAFRTNSNAYHLPNAYLLATLSSHVYHPELADRVGPGTEWNFETVRTIEHFASDTQAAVLSTPDLIVVVFRGTEGPNVMDWITDLNAELAPVPHYGFIEGKACKVHEGFNAAMAEVFSDVRDRIKFCQNTDRTKPVYFTGHSLGAAIAELCAFKYKLEVGGKIGGVYTFGGPRIGDHVFRTLYEQKGLLSRTFEVTNPSDPIPKLPTPLQGFTHVGNKKLVAWSASTPIGMHDIKKYSSTLHDSLSNTQKSKVPSPPN